jgi:hypothetical protein
MAGNNLLDVFDVVKPCIIKFVDLPGLATMACVSKKFEEAACDKETLRAWLPTKWFQSGCFSFLIHPSE